MYFGAKKNQDEGILYLPNQFIIITLLNPNRHGGKDGLQVLGRVQVFSCIRFLHGQVNVIDACRLDDFSNILTPRNLKQTMPY